MSFESIACTCEMYCMAGYFVTKNFHESPRWPLYTDFGDFYLWWPRLWIVHTCTYRGCTRYSLNSVVGKDSQQNTYS